jgi:hypothetical protein
MKFIFCILLTFFSITANAYVLTQSYMGNGITHWSLSCADGSYFDGYSNIPLSLPQVQAQATAACANHGGLRSLTIKNGVDRNLR